MLHINLTKGNASAGWEDGSVPMLGSPCSPVTAAVATAVLVYVTMRAMFGRSTRLQQVSSPEVRPYIPELVVFCTVGTTWPM